MAAVPSAAQADAVEVLYERHGRRVFGFCLTLMRRRDEAEDAVQTTFLHALGALRRGVVPEAESAWLLAIARNVCLARHDAARRRGNVEIARDPQELAEILPAHERGDLDLLLVGDAIARLPERQRRAILLREWRGLSYAELAEEMGMSVGAVETLLFRARRSLERELRDERKHGRDVLSLAAWAKSLLGGGAAKVAVVAGTVAAVGAVSAATVVERRHADPAPRPHLATPAAAARVAGPRSASPTTERVRATRQTRAQRAAAPAPRRHARDISAPVVAHAPAVPVAGEAPAPVPEAPTAAAAAETGSAAEPTSAESATAARPSLTTTTATPTAQPPAAPPALPQEPGGSVTAPVDTAVAVVTTAATEAVTTVSDAVATVAPPVAPTVTVPPPPAAVGSVLPH